MRRFLVIVAVLIALAIGSCQFLPERFAVNAPIAHMLFGFGGEPPASNQIRDRMKIPPGFSIALYADGLPPTARMLRFTARGDLLVSTTRSGAIVLLERDENGDHRADGMRTLLEDLNRPHGIELRDGWLYVGETDAITRIRFDEQTGRTSGSLEDVLTGLPSGGNHALKTIRFGPDGLLYFHVGSSCNVCNEKDHRRATIMRVGSDGSNPEIVATGLRNSVSFDWQPGTGDLYATDNGRDLLGDDYPPCELNKIEFGHFYGWPIANGNRDPDPDFGAGQEQRIAASTPPSHPFRAHNAPLGMVFLRDASVPAEYDNAALVALHGSWNRTKKDGYRVVSLHWAPSGRIDERDFVSGFELDGDVIGRPVDVVTGPDGAIYISDDFANVIWRVAYGEDGAGANADGLAREPRGDPLAELDATEREDLISRGSALYAKHACATCHEQAAAPAGTAARPLEKLGERYGIETLALLLETPPSPMPTFPLTATERRELAVFLLDRP